MPEIHVKNLSKRYGSEPDGEVAVDNIEFKVNDGEFVSIVGPSGCGKTTTLRCIAGLETPTSGNILVDGVDITNKPPQKRNLAMVFQDIALYPHMTVKENISYPLRLRKTPEEEQEEKIQNAVETLQISEHLEKNVGELSGGQSQRVALARAIVREPVAFLLDEPMSDLDAQLKMEMRKELGKIQNQLGQTMIYVTHDQEEAMTLSDRIFVMNDGKIADRGTPESIYQNPANMFVSEFIGSPKINFFDATLHESENNVASLEVKPNYEVNVEIDRADTEFKSKGMKEVVMGFRPRRTEIVDPGKSQLRAPIELNESIGDEVIQYLDGPQGELRVVTPVEDVLDEETEAGLKIKNSGVHIFDKKTGEKILRGNESREWVKIESE